MKLLLDKSLTLTNHGLLFMLKTRRDVVEVVSGIGAMAEHAELYAYDVLVVRAPQGDVSYRGFVSQLKGIKQSLAIVVVGDSLDIESRIHFLRLGVDELVSTDISDDELMARILNVVMRRVAAGSENCVRFGEGGEAELYPDARKVIMNGQVVPFSAREYDLVEALALRAGTAVPRPKLMDIIYTTNDNPGLQVIDVYVSLVRRKLQNFGGRALVKNKRGFGYFVERPTASAQQHDAELLQRYEGLTPA